MTIVAIDGPTGVGKSTTARAIAGNLGVELLLDPVSVSPLLLDYYAGEASPAAELDNELAFLRGRAGVLAAAPTDELIVADFTVLRTGPFAEFLDDSADRAIVVDAMRELMAAGPHIDVLVLLDAEPETLDARVRVRGREAETDLTIGHLVELRRHFGSWRAEFLALARSTIEIDTMTWDPRRADDLDGLVVRLAQLLLVDEES